jgi:hypothetical protein
MTKEERAVQEKEFQQFVQEGDICYIQIKEAKFQGAVFLKAWGGEIVFKDSAGKIWQSTEPYTLAVTKQVNDDDDDDENN